MKFYNLGHKTFETDFSLLGIIKFFLGAGKMIIIHHYNNITNVISHDWLQLFWNAINSVSLPVNLN